MFYYSTNSLAPKADFKEATIKGQAPDRGLYFPEQIPQLSRELIDGIEGLSKEEIALNVIRPYVGSEIPEDQLKKIVEETVAFPFPLVPVTENISSLELFHGPTLAFKDVGARFMSRCLGYFMQHQNKKVTVLVATSGDTGGAVANGFYNVDGVEVVILYPAGKVSAVQELQLTTLGGNITALEVEGNFDDCQRMVKDAFLNKELNEKLFLTSANSINVARWLPQQFYYFFAWQQWADKSHPPVISVPSGNFGNLCAGLLAFRSGLPVLHFIAACNANDVIPRYLLNGNYKAQKTTPTLSNAMDVGDPSNFVRILQLFDEDLNSIKKNLSAASITDGETIRTITEVHAHHDYLLDPHGAVGYLALEQYLQEHPEQKGFFLETAHPVKFQDVAGVMKDKVLPVPVQVLLQKKKSAIKIKAESNELANFLTEK